MSATLEWIDRIEREKFVHDSTEFMDAKTAISLIELVCPMAPLSNLGGGGAEGIFKEISIHKDKISHLDLKRRLIIDFPTANADILFKESYRERVTGIKSGLFTFSLSEVMRASASISPSGERVIFFADSIYSFLWDYYLGVYDAPDKRSADNHDKVMVNHLKGKRYYPTDFDRILDQGLPPTGVREATFFSSFFVFLHEIGHHIFSHDSNKKYEVIRPKLESEVETTRSIQFEYEADMFAFDCFVRFARSFLDTSDGRLPTVFDVGLKFLELLAKAQGEEIIDQYNPALWSHPPAVFRVMSIVLRHSEGFKRHDRYGPLISIWNEQLAREPDFMGGFDIHQANPIEHMLI